MSKTQLAQQVKTHQGENHDPDGKVDLTVQQAPVVNLVGNAQKLEPQCYLDETKHNFNAVEPPARFGKVLQKRRGKGKNSERKGKGGRESKHGDDRFPDLSLGGFYQYSAYDGAGARKRNKNQRECHEKDSGITTLVGLAVTFVHKPAGQYYLECPEEGGRKNHENQKEEHVGNPVRGKPVEDVGSDRLSSCKIGDHNDRSDGQSIQSNDRKPEETRHNTASG